MESNSHHFSTPLIFITAFKISSYHWAKKTVYASKNILYSTKTMHYAFNNLNESHLTYIQVPFSIGNKLLASASEAASVVLTAESDFGDFSPFLT